MTQCFGGSIHKALQSPRALTEAACFQEQLAAVVEATGNASESQAATQAQAEQRDRAPGLHDALQGKAPVLDAVPPPPQDGELLKSLCIHTQIFTHSL